MSRSVGISGHAAEAAARSRSQEIALLQPSVAAEQMGEISQGRENSRKSEGTSRVSVRGHSTAPLHSLCRILRKSSSSSCSLSKKSRRRRRERRRRIIFIGCGAAKRHGELPRKSPPREEWREAEVLRRLHAVAKRRRSRSASGREAPGWVSSLHHNPPQGLTALAPNK
jgi:hypothetical protein